MGMVADARLPGTSTGRPELGLLIRLLGDRVGRREPLGRKLTPRRAAVAGPRCGGIAIAGLGIAFSPTFEIVLFALLVMGMSPTASSIVAEQGIMMRRRPTRSAAE